MPTASVGAPPVRERIVCSPICCAVDASTSGVITKPQPAIAAEADSTVVPISAGGAFIAKYTPGCSTQAAIKRHHGDERLHQHSAVSDQRYVALVGDHLRRRSRTRRARESLKPRRRRS